MAQFGDRLVRDSQSESVVQESGAHNHNLAWEPRTLSALLRKSTQPIPEPSLVGIRCLLWFSSLLFSPAYSFPSCNLL